MTNHTIGVILTSDPGHGKTETALRFVKSGKGPTKRLVLDYEARATQYQAKDKDDFRRHLWAFDVYPGEFETPDATALTTLYKHILGGKVKPDVLIIDNAVLFQDELALMCSDRNTAKKLATAFGIYNRYRLFIDHNWRVGDAAWWGLLKAIIKQLLLACRRQRINVIITTELKNVWKDYGSRDKNKPAKILGKTAKLLQPWLQILDTVWQLSRKVKDEEGRPIMKAAPTVQIDPFSPKASLVGIPPKFEFTDWKQIWQWIEERGVPSKEDFAKVEVPEEQVYLEETAAPEEEAKSDKPKVSPSETEDKVVSHPTKKWNDFLEGDNITKEEALEFLGTNSVNAWKKQVKGRTLDAAIEEIQLQKFLKDYDYTKDRIEVVLAMAMEDWFRLNPDKKMVDLISEVVGIEGLDKPAK